MTELNSFESVEYTTEQLEKIINNNKSDEYSTINTYCDTIFDDWLNKEYYPADKQDSYYLSKNPTDYTHYEKDQLWNNFRESVCKSLHLDFAEKSLKQKPFQVIWDKRKVWIQIYCQLTAKQYVDYTIVKKCKFDWQAPKTRILMFDLFAPQTKIFKLDLDIAWKLYNKSFDSWIIPIKKDYWEIEKFINSRKNNNLTYWETENIPNIKETIDYWLTDLESPPDHE